MALTDKEVLEIAKKHGLEIQEDAFEFNESGLDFQVAFVSDRQDEKWVLRIPRREDVVPTAKKEKEILDLVGPRIPIEAPNWAIFTEELIAYKLLKGIPAGTVDSEKQAYVWEIDEKNIPVIFHETLGRAIAALHQVNHEEARQTGLDVQKHGQIRRSMQLRMDKVKERFGVSEELWARWQKWLDNDSLWPNQTALIHGDLHPGHLLIDENSRVTGLIDWTEARVDDPANDFVGHLMAFGEDALKALIKSYEKAGGYVWPSMFEHIVELQAATPVGVAEFAMKSGLKDFEKMAKQTLGVNN
ncbi:macrolide 2'-phosphotransferase [Virgibacillus ainsalahensis]